MFSFNLTITSVILTLLLLPLAADGKRSKYDDYIKTFCFQLHNEDALNTCQQRPQDFEWGSDLDDKEAAVISYLCCLGYFCDVKNKYLAYTTWQYIDVVSRLHNPRQLEYIARHLKKCGKLRSHLSAEEERQLCWRKKSMENYKRLDFNDFYRWYITQKC